MMDFLIDRQDGLLMMFKIKRVLFAVFVVRYTFSTIQDIGVGI